VRANKSSLSIAHNWIRNTPMSINDDWSRHFNQLALIQMERKSKNQPQTDPSGMFSR
jgi:hypothetical protein